MVAGRFGYADRLAELLEDGEIYFLYRPRVEQEHVDSLDEVQRLLVVMHPWHGRHLRLLVVWRKRLPDIDEHNRFWAFVDEVVDARAVARGTAGTQVPDEDPRRTGAAPGPARGGGRLRDRAA